MDQKLKDLEVRKGKNKFKVKLKTPDGNYAEIDFEPEKQLPSGEATPAATETKTEEAPATEEKKNDTNSST